MNENKHKTIYCFLIILIIYCINFFSCTSSSQNTPSDEYNYAEIAKYATFINNLFASDDNLAGFWWDCSDIVFRKELKAQPNVIQGIMKSYEGKPTYHKQGEAYIEESAQTAVKNMKTGWNLGNTLDSTSYKAIWDKENNKWYDNWASSDDEEKGWMVKWNSGIITWETGWQQPKTTNEIIALVKSLGFDAVRMPITWGEHIQADGTIDAEWLARVKECVDYVIANDMYCIINLHHDGGADGWIKACESSWKQYQGRFGNIWTQLANTFKDYDERLIFESMNEVLDENSTWNPNATVAKNANVYINKWNQLFVDSVRATGGNNATRNLIVMTYSGDGGATVFDNGFKLPTDTAQNHLIIEVHNYSPHAFTWSNATWTKMTAIWDEKTHGSVLKNEIGLLSKKAKEYGAPIIVGEYAAFPKKYSAY
ncbi:MAG: glycoside hydrolase family 5 protein [Treponema sp.]|nr:glycoside hydrolase family 5 protein [Treponema sp.]